TRSRPARSPSYAASPRTPQTTTRRPSSPRTTSTTSSTTQARTTHDHPAPLRSCLDDRHALLPPRRPHRPSPRRIHRQEQNMTAESSTHTYESGVQETVTLRRGPATPHDCALLKITYNDGWIAGCSVNTAWRRARPDQLTDTPRPLPPDAITNEMVERARRRFEELDREMGYMRSSWVFWQVLTAALTEPPARPEGAEKVEAVLHQYWS